MPETFDNHDSEQPRAGASAARLPELDGDGYPAESTLEVLRKWSVVDANAGLDFLASAWRYQEFGVSRELRPQELDVVCAREGDRFLRLATGGWSGNEELIGAFSESGAYFASWCLSGRGGLHIFKYISPPPQQNQSWKLPRV